MDTPKIDSEKYYSLLLFAILAMLVLFFRWMVLDTFAFRYVDSDQAIMWSAAKDFSVGVFHEPKFFGQNYNSMLEGLLSVPLIRSSVPVYIALPIITSILALFPFFLVSIICFARGEKISAFLILCTPLLLPIEYDFLTSLSRGFVTGIFVSSFGWIAIFFKDKKWALFCFGFFSVLGYMLNPNALLLSLPLFLYLFYENYKNRSFYLYMGIGAFLGSLILFFANNFYVRNPNYNSRDIPGFNFSFSTLWDSLQDLDKHLNLVSPAFWHSGSLIFVLLFVFIILLFKTKKNSLAFTLLLFLFCVFASFGLEKIHDGTDSVFFSYSRMFLSVPIAIVFFIPVLKLRLNWIPVLVVFISILFLVAKISFLPSAVKRNVDKTMNHIVAMDPIEYVMSVCQKINYYSKQNKTELVVVSGHGYYDFIDFGCAACLDSFPKTLRPQFERRTWRLVEDKDVVYSNIIIVDEHQERAHNLRKLSEKSIRYLNINGYYVISNNTLKTMDLLKCLEIPVRDF